MHHAALGAHKPVPLSELVGRRAACGHRHRGALRQIGIHD
jgi:hypothetical protein